MIRLGLVILGLALVVVLGARLVDLRETTTAVELNTPNDSDYYLLDAVVQQMDDTGVPEYRMTVAETLHYPDESARLTDINVNYLGDSERLWKLVAARGRIPAGERDILLHDGVAVTRNQNNQEKMRLTTERAWVRPDKDQVDTEVAVQANAPGQSLKAVGMTLFLKQNRVVLDSNVQVTYTP